MLSIIRAGQSAEPPNEVLASLSFERENRRRFCIAIKQEVENISTPRSAVVSLYYDLPKVGNGKALEGLRAITGYDAIVLDADAPLSQWRGASLSEFRGKPPEHRTKLLMSTNVRNGSKADVSVKTFS